MNDRPDYNDFTLTVDELRAWLRSQPGKALVLVNPGDKTGPFGVTGHAPATDPDFLAVVLTP